MKYAIDPDDMGMFDELTTDEKIKEYRVKTNYILLYTNYESLGALEEDYRKFTMMHKSLRRFSDLKSMDMFDKTNEARYNIMRNNLIRKMIKNDIIDDLNIKTFAEGKEEKKDAVKIHKFKKQYFGKYMQRYSNNISGMFVRIKRPVELIVNPYKEVDIVEMAISYVGKADREKILFTGDHKDSEVQKWLSDKNWGIVCFGGSRGYIYVNDTKRFYYFDNRKKENIDIKNPMTFTDICDIEHKRYNIPDPTPPYNELVEQYNYSIGSDVLTEVMMMDRIKNDAIKEMLKEDLCDRHSDANKIIIHRDNPYFTPYEMERLGISYYDKACYSAKPDQTVINEKPIKEWFEEYNAKLKGYNNPNFVTGFEWARNIQKLYSDIDTLDGQALLDRKQSILDLGWNPEVPFTDETRTFARERVTNALQKAYDDINYYEECGLKVKDPSIFIIFSEEYIDGYKSISISMTPTLEDARTWSTKLKTFSENKLKKDKNVSIFACKVTSDLHERLQKDDSGDVMNIGSTLLLENGNYMQNLKIVVEDVLDTILCNIGVIVDYYSISKLHEGTLESYLEDISVGSIYLEQLYPRTTLVAYNESTNKRADVVCENASFPYNYESMRKALLIV